jgi:hypothetical protein
MASYNSIVRCEGSSKDNGMWLLFSVLFYISVHNPMFLEACFNCLHCTMKVAYAHTNKKLNVEV